MSKLIKKMQLDVLQETFKDVRDVVVLNVVGLDAISDNQLRLGLRKKGIRLQVVKNTLARKVFSDQGLTLENAWEGSTTIAWGGNSIADLSKELQDLIKKHDKFIKVKTAMADGQEVSFEDALKMPTREEAIGQVIALALSPGSQLASALLGPGAQLASQLKSIGDKEEGGASETAEAPATA